MRHLLLTLLLCSSFFLLSQYDVEPQFFNPTESAFSPKTYAIVIGVTGYEKLNPTKELKFADDDAVMVTNYLKTWDNVELYLYTNKNATNEDFIGAKISELLNEKVKGNDKLIIYFSGHGDISKKDNNGYLLLNEVEDPTKLEYRWSDALRIADIKETILSSNVKTENVYLIFDACNSGFAEAKSTSPMTIGKDDKIVLMLSSESDELSNEYDDIEHGVFTYYLINGLKGLADKDANFVITENEIVPFVMDSVRAKSKGEQNPVFEAPYQHPIASYKATQIKDAEIDMNSKLEMASVETHKGGGGQDLMSSSKCQALMDLMLQQSNDGVFFQDQVDNESGPLTIGTLENVFKSQESISDVVRSRKGNLIGVVSNGKANIYGSLSFNYGVELNTTEYISTIAISPNEKIIASGGTSEKVQLWNGETGDMLFESDVLKSAITQITFTEVNKLAIGTIDGQIILMNTEGVVEGKVKQHKGAVNQLKSFNNLLFSVGADGKLATLDLTTKLKGSIAKDVVAFDILEESNHVLAIGGTTLRKMDVYSGKLASQIEFKSTLTSITLDPYERYAMIGQAGKTVEVIDLFNFQALKSKLKTQMSISDVVYVGDENALLVVEESGAIGKCTFEVNLGLSAFNLRQMLNTCENIDQLKYKLDGSLVHGLNRQVKPIMAELIKEDGAETTLEEIKEAKRYAEMALKMGTEHVLDQDKLEINVLLLEVYEILKSEDKSQYMAALKKVDRMKEIDPNGSYSFNVAADLYIALDNKIKAKEVLKEAEEKAPNWISPKMKSGMLLTEESKFEEAEAKFNEVLELNPQEAQAHAELAQVYLLNGDKKKAEESYNKAMDLDVSVIVSDTVVKSFVKVVPVQTVRTNSEFSNPVVIEKKVPEGNQALNSNPDLRDGLQCGDFYMGGTVFYIDGTGKHGLVAAFQSKYNALAWDVAMTEILKMELNGYSDWKMPSLDDLKKFGLSPVYAPVTLFWSSAEDKLIPNAAYWYDVKEHWSDASLKSNKRYVLPIRAF